MSAITSVLGKRERPPYAKHFYPSGPGQMPNVPNRPLGPGAPPTVGSQISVQSRSTVKYLEVNPTGSIPIMIRPWLEHYEKDYAPGSIIFCKQEKTGRSPLITCADVPTLNYLFHRGRGAGAGMIGEANQKKLTRTIMNSLESSATMLENKLIISVSPGTRTQSNVLSNVTYTDARK